MRGKDAIELTYDIVLSKKAPYTDQMHMLDRNGKLANVRDLAILVFSLAEIVDEQAKTIEELKDAITNTTGSDTHNAPQS